MGEYKVIAYIAIGCGSCRYSHSRATVALPGWRSVNS